MPSYEMIFEGNIDDQVKIARIFQQNMAIRENILKSDKEWLISEDEMNDATLLKGPSD